MRETGTPTRKKILLVEDHPIFRAMLVQLIEQELGMKVCGEAANHADALQLFERTRPDAAIVDLTLQNSNGLHLIADLQARHDLTPVLVLSMHAEKSYVERARRAGAKGYVNKEQPPSELIEAIRAVIEGGTYFQRQAGRAGSDAAV